jgi:hypothetical protein
LYALNPWNTVPPGEEIRIVNYFFPFISLLSIVFKRVLIVISFTGAKNLITTGLLSMFSAFNSINQKYMVFSSLINSSNNN